LEHIQQQSRADGHANRDADGQDRMVAEGEFHLVITFRSVVPGAGQGAAGAIGDLAVEAADLGARPWYSA